MMPTIEQIQDYLLGHIAYLRATRPGDREYRMAHLERIIRKMDTDPQLCGSDPGDDIAEDIEREECDETCSGMTRCRPAFGDDIS